MFVRASLNGTFINAGQTFVIPIGSQIEVVNDIDGNQYTVATIGTHKWMLQDLKTTKYSNGDPIPNVAGYDDWFLPSGDELIVMQSNLIPLNIGNFALDFYWSSSELSANTAFAVNFLGGVQLSTNKSVVNHVRACRTFTTTDIYNIGDYGPAGGWIFFVINNGGGSFTYLEAAPIDQTSKAWSNITNITLGTTSIAIGAGQTNTTAIITQSITFSDWFLPSYDELTAMQTELYQHGAGGLDGGGYWSSSEFVSDGTQAYALFMSYAWGNYSKSTTYRVRACRRFTTNSIYSLRDMGPAGGLIFIIISNGGGSFTYYEAAPIDQSASTVWSNITTIINVTQAALLYKIL